ncbi:rRNA pseudouridine synthase [Candidatus Peregrinibacteria bacterium]|nr:rRNA pseudouridine synthase [Candidatus Peregrinibacteria bacterium]
MRLNKFIASEGIYSRRKADEAIKNGLVKVNGETITLLGTKINPEKDKITLKDHLIEPSSKKIYIAFNKPEGVTSTSKDPFAKKTVFDCIDPPIPHLHITGRLDKKSEGLMILTNDGDLTYYVTHPKFKCEKEYQVRIKGELSEENRKKIEKGVMLKEFTTQKAQLNSIQKKKGETFLHIIIHEGKKRQIREMFSTLGYPVIYLNRIRIGGLTLGTIPKGNFKFISKAELKKAFPNFLN